VSFSQFKHQSISFLVRNILTLRSAVPFAVP
jgi:hypothetical protein